MTQDDVAIASNYGKVQEWLSAKADEPKAQTGSPGKCIMYFLYVLWSEKLMKRYVGSSADVQGRLKEHNSGSNKFTKGGIPWIVVHTEEFKSKTEARKRENFLKTGKGREWLNNQFPNTIAKLRKGAGVA